MTFTYRSLAPVLCVAAAALFAVGCGGDGIEKYSAPHSTERSLEKADKGDPHAGMNLPPVGGGGAGNYRILGAMYPSGQEGWFWFFKFAGPSDVVTAHEAEFDQLAKSVKLQGNPGTVPTFDPPAGWQRLGPRETTGMVRVRFDEVLKIDGVECTVSHAGGGFDFNVNRWAGQVGARAPAVTEFSANGVTARRVDLRGPNNPVSGGMGGKPPFAKQ